LIVFLVYVYVNQREGLRNYNPIKVNNKIYGVNTIKNDPNNIYTLLTTPGSALYNEKYTKMDKSDIMLDMQYFNNASYNIFQLAGN
jgi:hypothetical protein